MEDLLPALPAGQEGGQVLYGVQRARGQAQQPAQHRVRESDQLALQLGGLGVQAAPPVHRLRGHGACCSFPAQGASLRSTLCIGCAGAQGAALPVYLPVNVLRRGPGRVERQLRVCSVCGSGQVCDEHHLVFECAALQALRGRWPHLFEGCATMQQFMWQADLVGVAEFISEGLEVLQCV